MPQEEIKKDKVMELIVRFSGQTFSNSKDAYSWLDKEIRQILSLFPDKEEMIKRLEEIVKEEDCHAGEACGSERLKQYIKELKGE